MDWLVLNRGQQVHGADGRPANTDCSHLENRQAVVPALFIITAKIFHLHALASLYKLHALQSPQAEFPYIWNQTVRGESNHIYAPAMDILFLWQQIFNKTTGFNH